MSLVHQRIIETFEQRFLDFDLRLFIENNIKLFVVIFLFCCITYHVGLRTSCKDISCSFLISSTLAEMMGVPKSPSSTSKSPLSPRCLQHPAAGCGRGCGYWACPAKKWPPSCWLGWCMKLWMGWRLRQVDGCRHLHFLLEDSDDVWWDLPFSRHKKWISTIQQLENPHGIRVFCSWLQPRVAAYVSVYPPASSCCAGCPPQSDDTSDHKVTIKSPWAESLCSL